MDETQQNAHQRCLAGTVWTEQAVHAASLRNEVDFGERDAVAVAFRHAERFEGHSRGHSTRILLSACNAQFNNAARLRCGKRPHHTRRSEVTRQSSRRYNAERICSSSTMRPSGAAAYGGGNDESVLRSTESVTRCSREWRGVPHHSTRRSARFVGWTYREVSAQLRRIRSKQNSIDSCFVAQHAKHRIACRERS